MFRSTALMTLSDGLRGIKKVNGLALIERGQQMNRHPDQLQEWLNGMRRPFNKSLEMIKRFLAEQICRPCNPHTKNS